MPTSRYQDKVLETYARSLLEAAKAENHVFEDLEMIERLASASPEIIAVLDTMSKRDQLDLLPKVAAATFFPRWQLPLSMLPRKTRM